MTKLRLLQFAAAFQSATQCQFIGKLQTRACWNAVSNASDLDLVRRQTLGEIESGGVPFHVSAEREDNFTNWFLCEALFQLAYSEVLRFHSVNWRNAASQNMEFASVVSRSFDANDVNRSFYYADDRAVPSRIRADGARALFGQGTANLTRSDAFACLHQHSCQLSNEVCLALNDMNRQPLGRARADSGELVERGDQLDDRLWQRGQDGR